MNQHPCLREVMTKQQRKDHVVLFCERCGKRQQCIEKGDSDAPVWAVFKEQP